MTSCTGLSIVCGRAGVSVRGRGRLHGHTAGPKPRRRLHRRTRARARGDAAARQGAEEEVAALRRNLGRLELPPPLGTNCFAGSGKRWKTRKFGLGGIPEDPATGSAAGPLAVHLARHGEIGWGDEIEISQGAEIGRPSTLYARADGSAEQIERVEVGGSAVVVARGEFRLP